MKRKLSTLLFLLMTTFGTLMITGCGSSLTTYFTSDFPKIITERGQQNKDIAKELLDAGFIDKTMYSDLCAQIDSEVEQIVKDCIITDDDDAALNGAAVKTLSSAVSGVIPRWPQFVEYEDEDGNSELTNYSELGKGLSSKVKKSELSTLDDASLSHFVVSNYMVGQYLGKTVTSGGNGYEVSTWTKVNVGEPINFFGGQDDLIDTLNDRFRADMYVLDADAIQSSGKSLDEVFAAIKTAVDKDDISGVTHYFKKLENNGKAVTLLDSSFDLIGESEYNTDETKLRPGYDLVMKQKLYYDKNGSCGGSWTSCSDTAHAVAKELPVISVRFTEFNMDKFEELKKTININSGAYYFTNLNSTKSSGGQTTKCYVLTYPISVIDSFTLDDATGDVTAKFNNDTGMAVSIQTGKLISYEYDSSGNSFSTVCHEVTTNDPYLTMNFDASVGDEKSSLVCDGYRLYDINVLDKDGNKKPKTIVIPRIILRDYLEATWAPGSTKYDETLVVFGRKIRFRTDSKFWVDSSESISQGGKTYKNNTLCFNINNKDWCASFINVDGEEVGSLTKLNITDFCDIMALAKENGSSSNKWENYVVEHFREAGVTASTNACTADASEVTPTQDKLKTTTNVTTIDLSLDFPGAYIGDVDMYNKGAEVQRFYCVTTTKGMFDSALYSDWINSEASKESLVWWNTYLDEHGYDYTIGADDLSTYLETNYSYELSQEGAIILDLDTIHTIQEIFDREDADGRASLIRTIFVVLGIFLIAYSLTLMLSWVIDTNVDLGFSLTNKVTFGHWIAIQYDEELPTYNNEEKSYVDGKHMLIRCLIMIAVAIVVIRVDASEIILVLINTFGKIASYAEDMIRGLV